MKKVILVVAVLFLMISVTACQKEGPAEQAGKEVDKTMENLKEKME